MIGGYAHVFLSPESAFGAGHVAWGFWSGQPGREYIYGSYDNDKENTRKKLVWAEYGNPRNMTDEFRYSAYDGWKYMYITKAQMNVAAAKKTLAKWLTTPYHLATANCGHMVYDILRAYGVPNLPNYNAYAMNPKGFFDLWQGIRGNLMGYDSRGQTHPGEIRGKRDLYDPSV